MEGKERIISERVVSRKHIGKANPIARKFRKFKGSFGGICIAPVLIVLSLGLLYFGEKQKRNSILVESLSLESVEEVSYTEGMHKVKGTPKVSTAAEAPKYGDVLYYSYQKEEYQEVEETEYDTQTVIEEGEEYEDEIERVKLVEKWVSIESDSEWADFKLGNYTVNVSGADLKLDLSSKEYRRDYLSGEYYEYTGSATVDPEIGDYRIRVSYLPLETELLVVGEFTSDIIKQGEIYIITTKSDSQLISDMKTAETTTYWVMKAASWLLLTFGFLMILSPILSLLDFIPIAGKAASCLASVIAAGISLGIVVMGTLIIRYWWLFLIIGGVIVIGLVLLLILLISRKGGAKKEEAEKKEEVKEAEKPVN